ncbi:hypothetical protein DMJ13_19525 [halophilic archaeon]|nr:hypothetical protein DMJ13_19525 [halophilic archaeon]
MEERFRVTSLGRAAPTISISASCRVGAAVHVGTRSVHPTRVAALDLTTATTDAQHEVPGVGGIRGMVEHDGVVYFGTYHPASLYRIDPDGTGVTELAMFDDETFVWDVTAVDGCVYAGTYPNATVREYDVEAEEARSLGRAREDVDYARSIVAGEDTIYVGVGTKAQLVAVDRESGEKRSILPAELSDENMAYELALTEEEVIVRLTPDGTLCAIDRDDPSSFRLVDEGVSTVAVDAETVCGFKDGTVLQYGVDRGPEPIGSGIDNFEPFWLSVDDGAAVGASSDGSVWSAGVGDVEVIDLADAGMNRGAERPQAALALGDAVYVTSHGKIHRHRDGEAVETRSVPGEGKAMEAVDGTIYLATYPDASVVEYDPRRDERRTLATIGETQNRSRTIHYDEVRDALYVGTRPDYGHIGGAVTAFDRETGDVRVHRNVVEKQSISSIARDGEDVYLGSEIQGGLGIEPVATTPRLVSWDPEAFETGWELAPVEETTGIDDVVALDGTLYGVTVDGDLFVVDPDVPEVVYRGTATDGWTTLATHEGAVYGLSTEAVIRIDPRTYDVTTVVDGLDGQWYGNPRITIGDEGEIYALSGYDLARVEESSPSE